jgi:hypothetical protein
MTTPSARPPGVYRSRSSATRGYLIGRLQGFGTPASGSATQPPPSVVASDSAAPSSAPAGTPDAPARVEADVTLQAEAAASQQGTQTEDTTDQGGGKDVGWVNNGDWLRFNDVDFGATPPAELLARVSSQSDNGGRMEIRIDTPSSQPVATIQVKNTGGWQNWQTVTGAMTPVTGSHTVFVTFANDAGDEFMNLNYFTIKR